MNELHMRIIVPSPFAIKTWYHLAPRILDSSARARRSLKGIPSSAAKLLAERFKNPGKI